MLRTAGLAFSAHVKVIEMVGVLVRIFCFSMMGWHGPDSPFIFLWALNTLDAVVLAGCSIVKNDPAYVVLNVFWVGVGIVGIIRA